MEHQHKAGQKPTMNAGMSQHPPFNIFSGISPNPQEDWPLKYHENDLPRTSGRNPFSDKDDKAIWDIRVSSDPR